jgi:uncharacterized protein
LFFKFGASQRNVGWLFFLSAIQTQCPAIRILFPKCGSRPLFGKSNRENMKVTLITGASGGIGEALARRLAKEKHNLVLVARSGNKLEKLSEELATQYRIHVDYIVADLTLPGSDAAIFEETVKRNLEIDWLINNAGIGSGGDFLQQNLGNELAMMQLNMNALVALTHRFLPQMRERKRGVIVNVASMACFQPIPYMAVYAASKAFVKSFTEALSEENHAYNVQTMLLCPGATETGFFDSAGIGADRKESFSANMQTSDQVAEAAFAGIRAGERIILSGFVNKMMRWSTYLIPNSIALRIFGNMVRSKSAHHVS